VFVARIQGDPRTLSRAVEKEFGTFTGGLPVGLPMGRVRSMDDVLVRSRARADFNMLSPTIFAM
jgi:putative ABC transport system permease protein